MFFDKHNDKFKKQGNCYMLSEAMNVGKLEGEFKKYLKEVLLQYAKPYSLDAPNYWLIIGACMPKNNILLDCKKD
jgi:hypothetical protein